MDQKGIASAFIVAFGAMIVIAIVWNFFTPVMEQHIFGYSQSYLENEGITEYQATWDWARFIWRTWPIFMLVGLIIYMFLAAQRPSAGWYG